MYIYIYIHIYSYICIYIYIIQLFTPSSCRFFSPSHPLRRLSSLPPASHVGLSSPARIHLVVAWPTATSMRNRAASCRIWTSWRPFDVSERWGDSWDSWDSWGWKGTPTRMPHGNHRWVHKMQNQCRIFRDGTSGTSIGKIVDCDLLMLPIVLRWNHLWIGFGSGV